MGLRAPRARTDPRQGWWKLRGRSVRGGWFIRIVADLVRRHVSIPGPSVLRCVCPSATAPLPSLSGMEISVLRRKCVI